MKLGSREKQILRLIAKAGITYYSIFDPEFRSKLVFREAFGNPRHKELVKRNLKNLESKNLVILGDEKITLTDAGLEAVEKFAIDDLFIKVTDHWDNVWRVIAYDIPNDFKKERDCFRRKLQELGFVNIQKSLWAHLTNAKRR
jgi:hypothetical protein